MFDERMTRRSSGQRGFTNANPSDIL